MMNKRLYNILAVLMILSTLLTSCIKDSLSDCPPKNPGLWVLFSHDTDEVTDMTRTSIQRAVLYIFDQDFNFVTMRDLIDPQLGTELEITDWQQDLEIGNTYKFLVWYNEEPPYFTTPSYDEFKSPTSIINKVDARLYLDVPSTKIVDFNLPLLLYGKHNEEIDPLDQVVRIDLTQNTNTIHFTVNGLDKTTDTYVFDIADNNGIYNFDNDFASEPKDAFNYIATSEFTDNSQALKGQIMTLKLADYRSPIFTLKNETTGELLYPSYNGQENNLVKMIQSAYANGNSNTVDFDRRHIFHIVINFDTDMTATVLVDGWEMKNENNELNPDD